MTIVAVTFAGEKITMRNRKDFSHAIETLLEGGVPADWIYSLTQVDDSGAA